MNRSYAVFDDQSYNVHPFLLFRPQDLAGTGIGGFPATRVYWRLAALPGNGAVVEAPSNLLFPLYGFYQAIHRRPVVEAALGPGAFQEFLTQRPDLGLRRLSGTSVALNSGPGAPRYLIVHKRIRAEFRAFFAAALREPILGSQLRIHERSDVDSV